MTHRSAAPSRRQNSAIAKQSFAQFRSAVVEAEELQEGYGFRLPSDGKWMMLVAELIVAERECCPFLTFELASLPNKGPLILRVIGPPGTKEFVKTVLWKPTAST